MDLSVIIVNWNTKDLLVNCLNSLFLAEFRGDYEIWVVDNASSDGSAAEIKRLFPHINLITTPQNVGFGAANNLALRQCKGKYTWLLNPDTEVKPGAISHLVRFLDKNQRVGAAGSKFLNPDGNLQLSCYPFPTLAREFWRLFHLDALRTYGVYDQAKWDQKEPREVDVLQGASLVIRKEVLDQVGLFDEDYFMYTEEVDLCFRIKKAGWQLYWVPLSEVIHFGGQSTQQVAEKMFISLYQTKLLFFRKHRPWIEGLLYKLVLSLASIVRIMPVPLIYLEPSSSRERHFSLARNYQRLLIALWKS